MIHFIIDHREQVIKDHFMKNNHASKYNIKYENLEHGDIQIKNDNDVLVVLERKSLVDLVASIKDGRWKNQKTVLLKTINRKHIIYVIEGIIDFNEDIDIVLGGLSKKIIIGSILNTLIRDDIKIIFTRDINDTIHLINGLFNRILKDPSKYTENNMNLETSLGSSINIDDNMVIRKDKNVIDKTVCFMNQLCQIPSISNKTAKTLINRWKTMDLFYNEMKGLDNDARKKLLKEIKLENDKGSSRQLSKTVIDNLIHYCFD